MVHRALRIPEILLLIFTETQHCSRSIKTVEDVFGFLHEIGDNRAKLSVIARTSKSFSEPALDILWKDLPSIDPLILLLPISVEGSWPPTKELMPNDWIRFNSYATRVRTIREQYGPSVGCATILEWLQSARSTPRPLIPQLRHLSAPCDATYPALVIGTALLDLEIGDPTQVTTLDAQSDPQPLPSEQALPSWVISLPKSSPAVRTLRFLRGDMSCTNQTIVMKIIPELQVLREMGFSPYPLLSTEALSGLSTSKVLETLQLDLYGTDFAAWKVGAEFNNLGPSVAFAGLKELNLDIGIDPSEWKDLLLWFFSSAPLHTLNLMVSLRWPDDSFLPLFEWVASSHFSTLHTLSLSTPMRENSTALHMNDIQPLLAIRGIRHLSLEGLFDLNNANLLEIGSSLEGLVHLALFPGRFHAIGKPKLSLVGVHKLTKLRPSLEYLGLSISLPIKAPARTHTADSEPSRLKTLELGTNSVIGKAEVAYSFIQVAWPALTNLTTHLGTGMGRTTKVVLEFDALAELVSNGAASRV